MDNYVFKYKEVYLKIKSRGCFREKENKHYSAIRGYFYNEVSLKKC